MYIYEFMENSKLAAQHEEQGDLGVAEKPLKIECSSKVLRRC